MQEMTDVSPSDVAIVGMALRVPGAATTDQFWHSLKAGVESIRTVPDEEALAAGESAVRLQHPNYVGRTADVADMELFDAEFFGLSPKEAAIMDPQHRKFLECAWEAMEAAGRTPNTLAGPIGVFAGCGMGSYFYFNICSNPQLVDETGMFLLRHTGNDKDFLATRASFSFDLRGPSVNVQTACSTSLVAVHYACQSLLSGECDMALAGGSTIELPHRRGYVFQDGEILSPDGHCRPFDHRAAGTVFGSGAGVVVLRRLADAIADGDIIHGVIKASAVNNDGASKAGYLAPSVTGQAEAIIEAQGLGGIDADTIQFVECHGTGTALGDPIEIEALTQAFRQSTSKTGFCHVGSVKSNIGHLDTAAGVVGLIKATLAVQHGEIPPTLGFEKPNPAIDFTGSPFLVNSQLEPWPTVMGPRRAAVNSLGVGGTNAHVIIEEAPRTSFNAAAAGDAGSILVFSAKSRKALDEQVVRLGQALESNPDLTTLDAAHTLLKGRKHFEHRRVVAVRGRDDALAVLPGNDEKRIFSHTVIDGTAEAVFMFPGGGAQHVGMVQSLYREDARFKAWIEEGLSYLPSKAATDIRAAWFAEDSQSEAAQAFLLPSLQLPAILIAEIATARLWMHWGLRPSALIGHSMGENAAACIAGVMSYRDVVNLVRLRGELFDSVEPGGMLSVPLSASQLQSLLPPELDLASVNAPELCVVSGRDADLDRFASELAQRGIDTSRIQINIAAHSRMLDAVLPRFEAFLREIRLSAPTIPILSNLTGEPLSDNDARDPRYWVQHLRSTVLFAKGMAKLADGPARVYIEVGPGRALSSLAKAQPGIEANQVINTLPHPEHETDDRIHFLSAVGRAWALGLPIEPVDPDASAKGRLVTLPTYAFQRQRYFIEPNKTVSVHEDTAALLRQADMRDWGFRPCWRQVASDAPLDSELEPSSWLVFLDETGIGERLVARLRQKGHEVTTVSVGDGFEQISPQSYQLCPEDGKAGYDALVSSLVAGTGFPSQVVHLWLVTADETHRRGSSFFEKTQEHGFYSLFHLAQAMGDAAVADVHMTVVTNGMQRLGDEPLPYPGKATVLGPALVIPKELDGVTVRVIDTEVPLAKQDHDRRWWKRDAPVASSRGHIGDTADFEFLWEEMSSSPVSEVVAYRRGRRFKAGHMPLPLMEASSNPQFRSGGVYLLTGGLGDLSLVIARELIERYQARVILVGRTKLPERGEWQLYRRLHRGDDRIARAIKVLQEFEAQGAEVLYAAADVCNAEQMATAIAEGKQRFGTIHGVLHTAGAVKDNLIQLKSRDEIEKVLAPKVYGTDVLHRLLKDEPLELLVLFSSSSTDIAPAGQVDYVAANAYLNAYAESAAAEGRRTVAVHWGIWNEVGIAARAVSSVARPHGGRTDDVSHGALFRRWVEDRDGTLWLEFDASPESHWLWNEHRLVSGQPILPGTGYIELMLQAAVEYGFGPNVDFADLVFLGMLDIADGTVKRVRCRIEAHDNGLRAFVTAGPASGEQEAFRVCAEAMIVPHAAAPAATEALMPDHADSRWISTSEASDDRALVSAQEGRVTFGPRWAVLRKLSLGKTEALATLGLPEQFCMDMNEGWRLHPALLDIATGYAMDLVPEYGRSGVLWAPISYGRIRVSGDLPAVIRSHVRLHDTSQTEAGYAVFDVTIADPDGRILLQIDRFMVKRLAADTGFAAGAQIADATRRHTVNGGGYPVAADFAFQVSQGIRPSEGFELLERALATGKTQPILSSMPLDQLIQKAARRTQATQKAGVQLFDRPDLDTDYVAPRSETERRLAACWSELLGVERVGIHDNFFDIGGHSLIAVRLFRMIDKIFGVDLPISVLFRAATIAACADLIDQKVPADTPTSLDAGASAIHEAPTHLVAMSDGPDSSRRPVFLCAGMFGNVLNLRALALQLGQDRPVYCLQARGLYAGQEPHETFEAAARDCLAEIRRVQPQGPYSLGGFSGGGLIAYEMALQLRAAGETVTQLFMLDTPLPEKTHLTLLDRVLMKLQDIRRDRGRFVANWIDSRRRWAEYQQTQKEALGEKPKPVDLHNERVHQAFLRALERYRVVPYDGEVVLLRPRLKVLYHITGGRKLQEGRNIASHDNGWSVHCPNLTVIEVPGDHDTMVLNPNVRVMSEKMRQYLRLADGEATRKSA